MLHGDIIIPEADIPGKAQGNIISARFLLRFIFSGFFCGICFLQSHGNQLLHAGGNFRDRLSCHLSGSVRRRLRFHQTAGIHLLRQRTGHHQACKNKTGYQLFLVFYTVCYTFPYTFYTDFS